MPHVYFHLRRHDGIIEDLEGADFDDLEAAREEARQAAREIIMNLLRANRPADVLALRLVSEDGNLIEELLLTAVLPKGLASQEC